MTLAKGFMIINGKKVFDSKDTMQVINPATEEVMGEVPVANKEDIDKTIDIAQKSFLNWSRENPRTRSKILHAAAERVREEAEKIAEILTLEQGKPLKEARGEIKVSADILDFYAEELKRVKGINYWMDSNYIKSQVIYQPIGVIGAITPFNYPVSLTAFKVAPALATGNTVIVKPSSLTPLSVIYYLNCIIEAGLPDGVLNCLTGPGGQVVEYLLESPAIGKVSFTGSTETGRKIMSKAGKYLKKMTLELGGNSPVLIFKDADIERAVNDCVYRSFRNMGQICNSINRIYVEKSIMDNFVNSFIDKSKSLVIDNGIKNPDADLGPMASLEGVIKTEAHIKDALKKGACLKYGGKKPENFKKGFFFEPTVVTNVNCQMMIMNEETFGPVAPIMGFEDLEEGIRLSNRSPYGLVSYVYTKDLSKAIYVSENLQFGTVGINNVIGAEVGYPYGGWKDSGIGVEVSEHALYEYLNLKHIRIKI
ncbi:Succinate-semialdehyde dehydrogenase [NADP(+)] GabD [subsurface metagenome]